MAPLMAGQMLSLDTEKRAVTDPKKNSTTRAFFGCIIQLKQGACAAALWSIPTLLNVRFVLTNSLVLLCGTMDLRKPLILRRGEDARYTSSSSHALESKPTRDFQSERGILVGRVVHFSPPGERGSRAKAPRGVVLPPRRPRISPKPLSLEPIDISKRLLQPVLLGRSPTTHSMSEKSEEVS